MKPPSGSCLGKEVYRRNFLGVSLGTGAATAALAQVTRPPALAPAEQQKNTALYIREFLRKLTYRREQISTFLDTSQPNWATFDAELGYMRRNSILQDGVDGSRTISTFQPSGERTMVNYAGQPCRINAYGNSFTEGVQVNDGETWPEYLAAHLGEPVRNFGIGGYGFYQAYRRLLRQENMASGTKHIILNIWGTDDHLRSIDAWRWLRFGDTWRAAGYHQRLHGNPWAHIRLDLATGAPIEQKNPYPSPQSLYKLCDEAYVYDQFKDDLVVTLVVAERNGSAADLDVLERLAQQLDIPADFRSPDTIARTAELLHLEYALRASRHVVQKAKRFARDNNKKLLIVLSYGSAEVLRACEGHPRPDQVFVDFLKDNDVPFVDLMTKHVEDFRCFHLSPRAYVNRYFIGHYKPQGNHFFAFAIKDSVIDWLDSKPITYRKGSETISSYGSPL